MDNELFKACRFAVPINVTHTLENHANIEARDKTRSTPLIVLCSYSSLPLERVKIIKILLENGANINSISEDGSSALMRACAYGNLEVIEALLAAGSNVNVKTKDNRTVFHYVALRKNYEELDIIVNLLICYGAEVNELLSSFSCCKLFEWKYFIY